MPTCECPLFSDESQTEGLLKTSWLRHCVCACSNGCMLRGEQSLAFFFRHFMGCIRGLCLPKNINEILHSSNQKHELSNDPYHFHIHPSLKNSSSKQLIQKTSFFSIIKSFNEISGTLVHSLSIYFLVNLHFFTE